MKRFSPFAVILSVTFLAVTHAVAQPLADPIPQKKVGKGTPGRELETKSPDGLVTAFVRKGNLYLADANTREERQLTKDGTDAILNGKASWVYWEELYHRTGYRTYYWSPDSKTIAFLQLDER